MPYLTGSDIGSLGRYSLRLSVPQDEYILNAVKGAISELTNSYNWQKHGSDSVESVVSAMFQLWNNMESEGLTSMIGAVLPYATSSVPPNTLPCDGSTYQKVDYPQLYSVLDSSFIVDADSFRTPDLRGRAIVGSGQGTGLTSRTIGGFGGTEGHVLSTAEMPSHSHGYSDAQLFNFTGAIGTGVPVYVKASSVTSSEGSGSSHNNMQPYSVLRYCMIAR